MDEELASLEGIIEKMKTLGIPTMPSQIGISDTDALDAFVCSRDIRDRYLSTSMMWDAGALQVIA
ncbi:MAG: sn-glycerol-1-phosphate dehydrogenase, partial [Clostridia bacterium]|nr:sn-glycerol-1-phosphate dehydrogenase [Clostridia bacterium]